MMMDWAEKETDRLSGLTGCIYETYHIRDSLRKTKIEGFWQGVQVASDSLTEAFQAAKDGKDVDTGGLMAKLVLIAADIEKGNA